MDAAGTVVLAANLRATPIPVDLRLDDDHVRTGLPPFGFARLELHAR